MQKKQSHVTSSSDGFEIEQEDEPPEIVKEVPESEESFV